MSKKNAFKEFQDKDWKTFEEKNGLKSCKYKAWKYNNYMFRLKDNGVLTAIYMGKPYQAMFSFNCKNLRMFYYDTKEDGKRSVRGIGSMDMFGKALLYLPSANMREVASSVKLLRLMYQLMMRETAKYGFNLHPIPKSVRSKNTILFLIYLNIKMARGRVKTCKIYIPEDGPKFESATVVEREQPTDTWEHFLHKLPYPKSIRRAIIRSVYNGNNKMISLNRGDGSSLARKSTKEYTLQFHVQALIKLLNTMPIDDFIKIMDAGLDIWDFETLKSYYHGNLKRVLIHMKWYRSGSTPRHRICDIMRMAEDLNIPWEIHSNDEDLTKYHDRLVELFNAKQNAYLAEEVFTIPEFILKLEQNPNVWIPKTSLDLLNLGSRQHHCIGGYRTYSKEGYGFAVVYTYKDEEYSCWIGMREHMMKESHELIVPRVTQVHGKYNKNIDQHGMDELKVLFKDFHMFLDQYSRAVEVEAEVAIAAIPAQDYVIPPVVMNDLPF